MEESQCRKAGGRAEAEAARKSWEWLGGGVKGPLLWPEGGLGGGGRQEIAILELSSPPLGPLDTLKRSLKWGLTLVQFSLTAVNNSPTQLDPIGPCARIA